VRTTAWARSSRSVAGGAANSIAAKCDFTVKRDAQGSVLIRFLPDVLYIDLRGSPAAAATGAELPRARAVLPDPYSVQL